MPNNYRLTENNGIRFISLPQIAFDHAGHFFGTHNLNKTSLFNSINQTKGKELITVKQVHGTDCLIIKQKTDDWASFRNSISHQGYDAIITDQKDIIIGIYTADCIPILLIDSKKQIIAAIHAGWKGSVAGITLNVVNIMIGEFHSSPENIYAMIGPGIGQCCYEVGNNVVDQIIDRVSYDGIIKSKGSDKYMLDLPGLNTSHLISSGVPGKNIHNTRLCTHCLPDLFPSYRRDGKGTGRILSGIYLLDSSISLPSFAGQAPLSENLLRY